MASKQSPKDSTIGSTSTEVISGLSAGFITTLVTHPLDLIKIRLQLDSTSKTHLQGFRKVYEDIRRDATKPRSCAVHPSIVLKDYYRGIAPNLIGSATAWSLYFTLYKEFKHLSYEQLNHNSQGNAQLSSWDYLTCALAAGGTTSFLTNPIWVLKTRILSTTKSTPGAYVSLLDGIKRILREEGVRGFWKGLTPALISVSQGALQFTIYDTIKFSVFASDTNLAPGTLQREVNLSTVQYIYTSAVSKMISTVTLYPFQVIRSRLQGYRDPRAAKTNMFSVSRAIWQHEGVFGFYKGLAANLIRVVPATCITFVVYE
ncbi:hypothetical protein BABINDRAFT_50717, partial [Babjeviella inositovora NRRL Y-12698]